MSVVVIVGTSPARAQADEALLEEGSEAGDPLPQRQGGATLWTAAALEGLRARGISAREGPRHEDGFYAEPGLALQTDTPATSIDARSGERRRLRPGEVFAALVATSGLIALAFSIGAAAADLTVPATLVMLGVLIGGVVTLAYWLFPTAGRATGLLFGRAAPRAGGRSCSREAVGPASTAWPLRPASSPAASNSLGPTSRGDSTRAI